MKRTAPTASHPARPSKHARHPNTAPLLAPIRRHFASYPLGKAVLFASLSNVSDQTKTAFNTARRALRNDPNRPRIIRVFTRVFPHVRTWMKSALPDQALPAPNDVDNLVATLAPKMQSKLGHELFATIEQFVRAALVDPEAVAIMRQVNLMGPFPADASSTEQQTTSDLVDPPASSARVGLFARVYSFAKQFPGRRPGLAQALSEASDETKSAFKLVRRAFHQSENRDVIIDAVRTSLISVIAWAKEQLGDDDMPSNEAVLKLADHITDQIHPSVSRAFVDASKTFLHAALADQKVVQVLRQMRTANVNDYARSSDREVHSMGKEKGRMGLLALIKPLFKHYPEGRTGLFNDLKKCSPETKTAFKKMRRTLRKSNDTQSSIATIKSLLPSFWIWMMNSLGDDGVPSPASVDQLVNTVMSSSSGVDSELLAAFTSFLKAALSDQAMVDTLRKIRQVNPLAVAAGSNADVDMEEPKSVNPPTDTADNRKGVFAAVRPYFKQYPNGKDALFEDLRHVSPDTQKAFKLVKKALKNSESRDVIIKSVKEMFLVLHPWLKTSLLDNSMPSTTSISQLVAHIMKSMGPLKDEFGEQVKSLVEAMLADEAAVKILRHFRDIVLPDETVDVLVSKPSNAHGNRGLFAGIKPFFAKYPAGEAELLKSLELVSMDTKVSFRKMRRSVKVTQNQARAMEAAKAAFPVLRTWMNEELKNEGMPSTQSISNLMSSVGDHLRSELDGDEVVACVETFIRAVLTDQVAVGVLRNVREMGPFPWDAAMDVEQSVARDTEVPKTKGAGKKGLLAPLQPYFAMYPSGKEGLFEDLKNVGEPVKIEFRKAKRCFKIAENKDDLFAAGQDCIPIVRKWMREELGKQPLPSDESVTKLIDGISTHLKDKSSEVLLQRLTSFLGVALRDKSAIRVLRQVRKGGLLRANREHIARSAETHKLPKGFGVHHRAKCNGCNVAPIVGSRFKCTSEQGFDLCSKCYGDDKVSKEGKTFRECKFVWEAFLPDMSAPPAPLMPGERGPKVKFLHKVLTDLGYMDRSMYTPKIGMYGPKTREAVHKFQSDHGMIDAENGVYDDATAESLTAKVKALEITTPNTAAVAVC